jgi:GNAT superfamily N-acetyltransferase
MFREPSEMSLIEILQDRADTCFNGRKIEDESKVERFKDRDRMTVYQDGRGTHYRTDNDYIQTRERDGQRIAILVADENNKNSISHPHSELPHLMGLYVREPYRSEGIASELIHEFMETVDHDRCVVDCADRVKPFYEQLDSEVVYLEQFKSV